MGSNAITSAGVLELKQSFICNRTIEILELENAKITSDGKVVFLFILFFKLNLEKLNFNHPDDFFKGIYVCTEAVLKFLLWHLLFLLLFKK